MEKWFKLLGWRVLTTQMLDFPLQFHIVRWLMWYWYFWRLLAYYLFISIIPVHTVWNFTLKLSNSGVLPESTVRLMFSEIVRLLLECFKSKVTSRVLKLKFYIAVSGYWGECWLNIFFFFAPQWPGCAGGGGREDVEAGSCWDCAGGGAGGWHRASRTCPGAAGVRVDSSWAAQRCPPCKLWWGAASATARATGAGKPSSGSVQTPSPAHTFYCTVLIVLICWAGVSQSWTS